MRPFPRVLFCLLLAAVAVLTFPRPSAAAQYASVKEWEAFPFSKQTLDPAKLEKLSLMDLKLLRGLVFGRHGRVFEEKVIQDYLKTRRWYKPDPKYRVEALNAAERKNMDLIKEAEHRQHKIIEPGDLKFYREKRITEEMLGEHTGAEWRVMRAEVEAIHGKRFPDEPWLQAFFNERYWYKPAKRYDPKALSEIERANIATITAAWKKQRGVALSPGDMGLFQDKRITPEMLDEVTLHELRLLRNEVYARRGQRFGTGWLADHFSEQHWYEPLERGRPELSLTEERNVAVILARESELHEELSRTPFTTKMLEGLYLEDARKLRNEIYARRGRMFQDPWLQSYFASLPWYRPDRRYSDRLLSAVERENAAVIREYERTAASALRGVAA